HLVLEALVDVDLGGRDPEGHELADALGHDLVRRDHVGIPAAVDLDAHHVGGYEEAPPGRRHRRLSGERAQAPRHHVAHDLVVGGVRDRVDALLRVHRHHAAREGPRHAGIGRRGVARHDTELGQGVRRLRRPRDLRRERSRGQPAHEGPAIHAYPLGRTASARTLPPAPTPGQGDRTPRRRPLDSWPRKSRICPDSLEAIMHTARTPFVRVFLALLLVLGLGTMARAQTGAASITGLLIDESGAAVPAAHVTATNQATNVAYTAVSNDAGNYTITSVPVGGYVVKAELSGFKTPTTKPIHLEAKQIARIDFKLQVGSLEDTVEVTAEGPVLQTESATVGEVISGNTVNSLPLNGRNTGQLSLLLPGVVTPNPQSFVNQSRNFSGGRPYVNGNREQTNNYMIDGVDMNESIDNLVAYQPSPDALAEISVETNNYAADTGNVAGAVLSNVIKSGSNTFHGNAFEFYRNSSL